MLTPAAPSDRDFFDTFDQLADCLVEAAHCLVLMLDDPAEAPAQTRRVDEVEHRADELTHRAITMGFRAFVPPIDRRNVQALVGQMDDVVDMVDSAVRRMTLYRIHEATPTLKAMARVLHCATLEIQKAVKGLRKLKQTDPILKPCIEVNRLENEGDELRDQAISVLVNGQYGAIDVLRWKDVYEDVENAIDRCEDVADVLQGVVLSGA